MPRDWIAWSTSLGIVFALMIAPVVGAAEPPFADAIEPILKKHCVACHAGKEPKGELRLDVLAPDFASDASQEAWLLVATRVASGEMPPKEKPRLADAEKKSLTNWIYRQVDAAVAKKREGKGRVVLRRLNRIEYENTIRDLLGIELELKEMLPLDSVADGFDNVAEALHTSSFLLERYLEAADAALDVAIANKPQPPLTKKRFLVKNERGVQIATEKVYKQEGDTTILFSSSQWNAITVGQFYPPYRGKYRFRVAARAVQSGGKPVSYRVDAGPLLMGTKNHLVSYYSVLAEPTPTIAEWTDHLEARSSIRILPHGIATAHVVNKIGADKYDGPGLAIDWFEVEGPLHEIWPPESHRHIFGELPQVKAPIYNHSDRLEVSSKDPLADTDRILRSFARRAYRRAVSDADIAPLVAIVKAKLDEKVSFEASVRVALKSVLISPDFLFLREKPGELDEFALANRLSYFLWSSMPDETLLKLAEEKKLSESSELRRQVERMLADPRANAFTENFVGQWLKLRDINFTAPDGRLYPEFDDMLRDSMVREAELFFEEVLKHDLSVTQFVSSDFSFLNERLARHYGIPGVEGWEMRKVKLPPESHRGGVLTMASVLKVTANGTTTSPVVRGAFVLDRILGTPPQNPPDGVSAVEPDIRGAKDIRDQLAKHRTIATCASCHTQIDPPGFALESFDVIGGYRTHYRSIGVGKEIKVEGKRVNYYQGKPVDCADELPDGRKFSDIDMLKKLLCDDRDQIARSLAGKLLTYGTGRAPRGDQAAIEGIVAKAKEKNYGLRSLLHEVVQSAVFRSK